MTIPTSLRLRFLGAAVVAAALATTAQGRTDAIPEGPGGARPPRVSSPRLAPLPDGEWSDAHKAVVAKYAADGRAGNALRTLLHIPPLADSFLSFPAYLSRESTLQPRHRELLILRTAWLM